MVAKIIATEIAMDLGREEDEDVAVVSTIHDHHQGRTVLKVVVNSMSTRGNLIGLVDHSNYLNRMEDGRKTLEPGEAEEEEEGGSVTTVVRVRGHQNKSAMKLR